MQEAARSRYNDVLDFDSSSAILKIEWREEGLGFTAHVQPFLSPVGHSGKMSAHARLFGGLPVIFLFPVMIRKLL